MNWRWRLPAWNHWGQKMQVIEIEDSIRLRVLVLALVIVGIAATDIAADTRFSLWAVPLSAVGGIWSYYRRRNQNIAAKFCIAVGMLVALLSFLGRLSGELNDTRLALAGLLIQLQVLHSFDMPRRKDLGYSIVIGVILLGVAGTLSQTLAFAPMLLLFLVIALPTLVFNYRSRLGLAELKTEKLKKKSEPSLNLNVKLIIINFLAIVGLGLLIFAVLPRFPGYQLRTFPVSAPIDIKGNFTGRNIVNPGYVYQGNENKSHSTGSSYRSGENGKPGQLNSNFYYGFNSQINQNLHGEMKPKVVMRVRSQAEGFWRVLAFDHYTGKGWEISRNDKVQTFKRSPWSYSIFLYPPQKKGKTQEIVQTYTVVSELPNLIPAMADPKEIYFPTPIIAVDPENGLRSPTQLLEGLTYTVISQVPYRDRTLLGTATNDYPDSIKNHYLEIPSKIAEKIHNFTQEILAGYNNERVGKSEKNLDSAYEKTLYLAQYLKQHYSIPSSLQDLPYLSENEDLVEAFLFKNKGGYQDHFSTVLTIMLRSIGIPARLVAGFAPGQFNPFTGMYVVHNTDAYAMTEVYFPKYGWFSFDPIPNHSLIPPSVEDTQTFTVLKQFWHWVASWLPSPVNNLLNNVFARIFAWVSKAFSWFLSLFFRGTFGLLTALILLTGIGFLGWISWEKLQQWRYYRRLSKLPPMESLYQQMLGWAAKKGLVKHPAQTPLEYARISYQYHTPAIAQVIDEICQAYVSWRYGGQSSNLNKLRQRWRQISN